MELWKHGKIETWKHEIMKAWKNGKWKNGNMGT